MNAPRDPMAAPRRRASDQRGALPDAGVSRTPHDTLDLDDIRACMEGTIPGVMATCDGDGMPNVTYVSQVEYVDARQLALSFQFFNKTRRNVLANPHTELLVVHPRHESPSTVMWARSCTRNSTRSIRCSKLISG